MASETPECTKADDQTSAPRGKKLHVAKVVGRHDSDSEELLEEDAALPQTPPRRGGRLSPSKLSSPHFSMDTPKHSPREEKTGAGDRNVDIGTPLVLESQDSEASGVQYEWQFEILNNLPRDTAMALVDHLQKTETEYSKATKYAVELSRTNKELHRRLQSDPNGSKASRSLVSSRSRGGWCGRLSVVCLVALAAVLVGLSVQPGGLQKQALQGLDFLRRLISSEDDLAQVGSQVAQVGSQVAKAAQPESEGSDLLKESRKVQSGSKESSAVVELGDGRVRETTVREMLMRETTTRDYDPNKVQQLQTENLQMKLQLERLWLDIDDAVHRGQDTVCWKL